MEEIRRSLAKRGDRSFRRIAVGSEGAPGARFAALASRLVRELSRELDEDMEPERRSRG